MKTTKKLTDVCLPKQWRTLSLSDLTDDGYLCYGANGIIGHYKEYNHEHETIMITCRGATCGTINYSGPKSYINGNAMCLENLDNDILPKYLYYYLKSCDFSKVITGSGQPQITRSSLSKLDVIIYDKKTQKEIVSVFDNLSMLINNLSRCIDKYDLLVKSQFIEMFDKKNFGKVRISDVVDKNILSVKKAYKKMDFIKYIDIGSIDNKSNLITSFKTYLVEEAPSRAQQCISYNDILVSTVRPNLKNIAINKYDGNDFVASSGFCVLRSTKINPHFLLYCVLQNDFTDSMVSKMTGANYPAIKNSDVYSYEVFNAPNALQDKFASFVSQIDKSKFRLRQLQEKLDTLYKSLLQKYFG